MDRRQVMDKELAEMIEENGIVYHLAKDGCYYPDVRLPGGGTPYALTYL